jgi:hypothetical protein
VIVDHRTREQLLERRGLGIFMPKLWADAIEAQERRIAETQDALRGQKPFGRQSIEDFDLGARLNWEAYFLVLAIRQLLYTHEECLKQTGDGRLIEARAEFDAAVPNAREFRNILEHMHEYFRDEGLLQKQGVVATGQQLGARWGRDTGRVTMDFGDMQLDLWDAADAALALAQTTANVWAEHLLQDDDDDAARRD